MHTIGRYCNNEKWILLKVCQILLSIYRKGERHLTRFQQSHEIQRCLLTSFQQQSIWRSWGTVIGWISCYSVQNILLVLDPQTIHNINFSKRQLQVPSIEIFNVHYGNLVLQLAGFPNSCQPTMPSWLDYLWYCVCSHLLFYFAQHKDCALLEKEQICHSWTVTFTLEVT